MIDQLIFWLPWVLSAVTVASLYLAGNKNIWAWILSIGNQAVWLLWIVLSASWGLIPGNIALWYVSIRNYRKWKNESSG